MANEGAFGGAILLRVERLTLIFGAAGAVWAGWRWGWLGALGLIVGAFLSWLNFRWLKGGVQAIGAAAVVQQADTMGASAPAGGGSAPQKARGVGGAVWAKFLGRYALLLIVLYVILTRSPLPVTPVFAGLFAAAAAVVAGIIYELAFSGVGLGAGKGT